MRILVSEKLSENRFKTPEGYLICTNAILARTGKQTYLRREVFGDSCNDADNEVEVDRTAEEVFAPETLASFENKPLCVEHPDEDVNADNHNLLSVGYVRDVKKDVVDGNEVMTATLVITDKFGIDEVESGRKTDLSCGYDCDIIDDEHPQQRHIRGNHVAICERGRAGIARIVDSDVPRGYKVTGNNYAWELSGKAKSPEEAAKKFIAKYPEISRDWGLDEIFSSMIAQNKREYKDGNEWAIYLEYEEDTKYFYAALVEKKHRYDDSIEDAQHHFEVCYINYDKYCVVIEAKSTDDAVSKFRRKYGMYHIVHVKQIDSMKNMEDSMKKYAEDKHGRTFTLEEIEGGKVKATNMGGREKIFSGWKEAEEEFGKRGIAILDSFYDIVEDSVKDAKYVIMHPRKNLYLTVGAKTWSHKSDPMIKKFDSEKEAEEYAKKNTSDFKIAVFDSVKDEDRLWKVYLTGASDVNNVMYVKADNEAMARKIAERNTDEEVIKIREYGDTPLTKIDKERILKNPNRYFDSEKKIEKIARIIKKLN